MPLLQEAARRPIRANISVLDMEPKRFDNVTKHLRQRAEDKSAQPSSDSAAHLRTLSDQIDAIARGEMGAVLDGATDDVTLTIFVPPEFPFIRTAKGSGAFRRALEHNFAAVTDQRPEVQDIFSEGNTIVLFGRETGILRSTGARYDVEFVERFTFRDGRLAAVQIIAAHARDIGD